MIKFLQNKNRRPAPEFDQGNGQENNPQASKGVALNDINSAHKAKPVPVTVVICSRNRGSVIGRCLDSVIHANPAEILVVDGNSTDGTVAVAHAKGVRVISDNGAGFGAARQLGAYIARNEYVVFVDTDVVVEPETLQQLYDEAYEEGYDALEAELHTWSDHPTYWQEAERWRHRSPNAKRHCHCSRLSDHPCPSCHPAHSGL